MSRYAGREIELLFSTDPGPKGDVTGDLAGWVGLRFAAENETPPEADFKTIYNGEALVYEVPNVLPRAALFRSIEVMPDDAVLARLKDPGFNPYEKAVVSRESVPTGVNLSALIGAAPAAPSAARILRYQSQHVSIEAETPVPALLVLNDTNYPGWRVYVNGQPAEMLTANFLFRGVLLPPGKSIVEFKYQPRSYPDRWRHFVRGGCDPRALDISRAATGAQARLVPSLGRQDVDAACRDPHRLAEQRGRHHGSQSFQ